MGTSPYTYSLHLFMLLVLSLLNFTVTVRSQTQPTRSNSSISAIFVFGDSTVDPGNNNYIKTLLKADFQPYGRDFVNHTPTGRFCNGRLVTDFIASYAGIKDNVPPYLDSTLSIEELMTGVSFASAGSGFDPLTAIIDEVISVKRQVEYFKEYKTRIEQAIGKERTGNLINKAIFVISAGTNDFVVSYLGPTIRRKSYNLSSYHQFLMQNIQQLIQDLLDLGARKIAIAGLVPIECLPVVITLYSNTADSFQKRECVDSLSSVAIDYNQILGQKLRDMQKSDAKILYADIYTPISDVIKRHKKYGFDEIKRGCCGTGLLELSYLCNPESSICSDVSKYVFFDSIHPTERAYNIVFKAISSTIDLLIKG